MIVFDMQLLYNIVGLKVSKISKKLCKLVILFLQQNIKLGSSCVQLVQRSGVQRALYIYIYMYLCIHIYKYIYIYLLARRGISFQEKNSGKNILSQALKCLVSDWFLTVYFLILRIKSQVYRYFRQKCPTSPLSKNHSLVFPSTKFQIVIHVNFSSDELHIQDIKTFLWHQ